MGRRFFIGRTECTVRCAFLHGQAASRGWANSAFRPVQLDYAPGLHSQGFFYEIAKFISEPGRNLAVYGLMQRFGALLLAVLLCGCRDADAKGPVLESSNASGRQDKPVLVDAGMPNHPKIDPFAFDPELFTPKRPASSGDWLTEHPEPGQTFGQYLRAIPMVGTETRKIIVLQPLGPFTREERASLETLAEFTRIFFQRQVRIEKPRALPERGQRQNGYGRSKITQYLVDPILKEILLPHLPDDALCYLGITMADLYPDPAWNYVFGMASFRQRVGVYSLIRYTNRFWGREETAASRSKFLQRAVKVLAHETVHMFSIAHCTHQECLMNGSNNLREMDDNRIQLCPICLQKLHWNLEFDIRGRYQQLADFYGQHDMKDWEAWTRKRLAQLGG
jgi:archaemetzincin